jgi:hypothetical protein
MILDKNGNPLSSSQKKWIQVVYSYTSKLKTKFGLVFTALATLAVILANLNSIYAFYEKVTDGPTFNIPIEVHNSGTESVEVAKLLDLYITSSQFYSGRLMGGEQPTSRIILRPYGEHGSYVIKMGSTNRYSIAIPERPYKDALSEGGATIVFVLRLNNRNTFSYIEQPFHRDIMTSIRLAYKIE